MSARVVPVLSPRSNEPGEANNNSPEVKVFSCIDTSKAAAALSWESLTFSVTGPKRTRKHILKGLNGSLIPGRLTCILGPSGSGKTSLLNILAGRVRRGGASKAEIGGKVKLNGQTIEPSSCQQLFGYVMQDDALLGTMTPREVLSFAARLRLDDAAAGSRDALIEDLLKSLGLLKCADSMVGNELIKGISGGERKRTAVGAELITNPQITFLDEPTSGLDTGAAHVVISILRQLALLQRSVLCTIHQPSSEIFHLFDTAIFLVQGCVIYQGPPSGIRSHFSSLGRECPKEYNPADFLMFLLQTEDEQQIASFVKHWSDSGNSPVTLNQHLEMPQVPSRKSFHRQLSSLVVREFKNVIRDQRTLLSRVLSTVFLSLIASLVFFRIGSTNPDENIFTDVKEYDMQSHFGGLTMLATQGMMGSIQPLLLTFALERPVFMREHASNMYGPVPYFLSKTALELPLLFLQTLLAWLLAFWMMGMQGNFFVAVLGTMLISMASASSALLVACLVKNAKQALELAPALFVPQLLFAGFFIKMELVPPFMRWLQYLCALKWGMNILMLNEFSDVENGDRLLDANNADEDSLLIYYIVLLLIFVAFRVLATIALARKAKAFYN